MRLLALLCCSWCAVPVVAAVPSFSEWRQQVRPASYPAPEDYLRVLSRWPAYAEADWHEVENDPSMAYYGPGESGWGMMCLASAMFCCALLATDDGYSGTVSREALLRRVNQGLKFMTRTHATGDLTCTNGAQWSDARTAWHSATWAENMGAAADLAWAHLGEENRAGVRRVLTHEAARLSEERIPGTTLANTQAESNAWNASVLARAAVMFAEDPRAVRWREKAMEWAMNTLSAPQDENDRRVVDGRRVRDWVSAVNVHRSFASENHGFYHVCYMWWPMWCLSSAHYSFASHRLPTPRSVFHHWRGTFGVLKRSYLADGRFAYPAGKDWPRYLYGLTAAMPAYVVLADELGEPAARAMEREAFARYEWEQLHNGDGSFVGKRLAALKASGEAGYRSYCRYEADEAIMLGLAYALHRLKPARPPLSPRALAADLRGGFECPDARVIFRRDDARVVGWSWKTRLRRPHGTLALPGDPSLAEDDGSLCATFGIEGEKPAPPLVSASRQGLTKGGLFAAGVLEWGAAAPAPDGAVRFLRVSDANVASDRILQPEHPVFNTPNKLTDLRGMTDLDSITAASPDWVPLAANVRGGPSLVEARVGKGRILICMVGADSDYVDGKPGGRLFENLVAYARAHARGRLGYVAGISSARRALEAARVPFESVTDFATLAPERYGAVVVDRGSPEPLRANAWRLVRYAERGGLVVRFCLHDDEWREDELSGVPPRGAITHRVGLVALPDGRTTLLYEHAVANRALTLRAADGLNLHVGNDVFNGGTRRFHTAAGALDVPALGAATRELDLSGAWANVDDRLGIAFQGAGSLHLTDRAERTAPHQSYAYETLSIRPGAPGACDPGAVLLDHVVALYAEADHAATARLAAGLTRARTDSDDAVAAWVATPSGRRYLVVWNFADQAREVRVEGQDGRRPVRVRVEGMGVAYREVGG